jgi:succinate dehydrogenase flavin-adding protein (antitoxin of CptAB toxin-antitoxin module)
VRDKDRIDWNNDRGYREGDGVFQRLLGRHWQNSDSLRRVREKTDNIQDSPGH